MENQNIRIVEINGVKVEVDLRTAKRVDTFKVGDSVKVLIKTYSGYETHGGVIVSFDEFNNLPTIVVAYVEYSGLKFAYINAKNPDTEIVAAYEHDSVFDADNCVYRMNLEIEKKKSEVVELQNKLELFKKLFGKFFKVPIE